jgi:hypothetical protein
MERVMSKILLILAFTALSTAAHAQSVTPCMDREAIVQRLLEKYQEVQQSIGLSGSVLVEVFVSFETGSWTILMTDAGGRSCVLASGQNWEQATPLRKTKGTAL